MTAAVLLAHIDIPPKLLASLIVLGLVLVIFVIKKVVGGGTKAPQPGVAPPPQGFVPPPPQGFAPPPPPVCPTCGTQGRWLVESNAWGCDRCRALIGPPNAARS